MSVEGARECPICGAPVLGETCNYCGSQELLKQRFAGGKCRNCGAKLDLLRDKDGWLTCRYCGWPIAKDPTQKIVEQQTSSPVVPPVDSGRDSLSYWEILPLLLLLAAFVFILPLVLNATTVMNHASANITQTTSSIAFNPIEPFLYGFGFAAGLTGLYGLYRLQRHIRNALRHDKPETLPNPAS